MTSTPGVVWVFAYASLEVYFVTIWEGCSFNFTVSSTEGVCDDEIQDSAAV